jgi:hypothetical protein
MYGRARQPERTSVDYASGSDAASLSSAKTFDGVPNRERGPLTPMSLKSLVPNLYPGKFHNNPSRFAGQRGWRTGSARQGFARRRSRKRWAAGPGFTPALLAPRLTADFGQPGRTDKKRVERLRPDAGRALGASGGRNARLNAALSGPPSDEHQFSFSRAPY